MPTPLGQHLLSDDAVIGRVLDAAALAPGDRVLDAGAGKGALTRPIAAAVAPGGHVWAVDVDPAMVAAVRDAAIPDATVVEADLLQWPLPDVTAVVANPPFKIAAPLIERLAGLPGVFVVPRELADRLAARPGTQHYGKLTVRLGIRATVEDLGYVSRHAFTPPPGVTCGIIRLRPRDPAPLDPIMLDRVLDAAWEAWDRKARHAFSRLPFELRTDSAALSSLVKEAGWADQKTRTLPPDAFAAVARHLFDAMNA